MLPRIYAWIVAKPLRVAVVSIALTLLTVALVNAGYRTAHDFFLLHRIEQQSDADHRELQRVIQFLNAQIDHAKRAGK